VKRNVLQAGRKIFVVGKNHQGAERTAGIAGGGVGSVRHEVSNEDRARLDLKKKAKAAGMGVVSSNTQRKPNEGRRKREQVGRLNATSFDRARKNSNVQVERRAAFERFARQLEAEGN